MIRDSLNTFRLAETIYESNPATEKEINITSNGSGTHTFALVNPKIDVVRNSDLQFNLQDPSLFGYQLRVFREKEFVNEFVSVQMMPTLTLLAQVLPLVLVL